MAKTASSHVKISGLNYIVTNCDKMFVCAGQPTNYANANNTAVNKIASWAMTTGTGTDYELAASGNTHVLKVVAQASLVPQATLVADHIALCSVGLSSLIFVTTCGTQLITDVANKISVSSWSIEIEDAT